MKVLRNKLKGTILILFLALAAAAVTLPVTSAVTEAATKNGFQTVNGTTYYYSNGKKVTGWLTLNGKKYFFKASGEQIQGYATISGKRYYFTKSTTPSKRYMAIGWRKDTKGQLRYFDEDGVQARGTFMTIGGKKYYFDTTGIMKTGWITVGKYKYYSNSSGALYVSKLAYDAKRDLYRYFDVQGRMARGWKTFKSGVRYFQKSSSKDGVMARGFLSISGKTYFFSEKNGFKQTGWLDYEGNRYYLDPQNDGVMVVSTTKTIDGIKYSFSAKGVATYKNSYNTPAVTDAKTIKNYLAGAMQPVGQALYVWGGGWNDSTRKGVSPRWKQWYDSQSSSYDYNNYRDLSDTNRAKGLDCSGFVGWAAYQVMGGYGYTVVAEEVGSYYKSLGWGTIITQSKLSSTSYKMYAGDVGYNSGHTWICVGQCKDKSIVIVHSTPQAGCQIAGTPTPSGDYDSQAIALAVKYMSKYPGYTKYDYHTSTGNYIRNGQYLRWNRKTLADPDGYLNMTADQILKDLFGY